MNATTAILTAMATVLGYIIHAARDAYVANLRHGERRAAIIATGEKHEREVTERFALDALDSRRKSEDIMREQSAQITELSVRVARCDEQHAASKIELDMTKQLAERQRVEIDRLHGEVATLTTALDDLRDRFDRFVASAMDVRISSVPPSPEGNP